ncbi:MAG TPA: lysophospholipid acyltransferase family protein [Terriglobales bacterium]|nr:lysophospholipid acyltransferase family protein [Terriglobales bacterium]
MEVVSPPVAREEAEIETTSFSLRQRLLLRLVSWAGALFIRLIAPTLKYTVSIEEGGPASEFLKTAVYVFWHRCTVAACYHFRGRQIGVMTSRSFDGEYIARIISHFGYEPVRGSSSRGGVRALLGMHRVIDAGRAVAFTIDGPRGPMYVAKPGAVLLARNTQTPIVAFHIAAEKCWVLHSWDRFMLPKPFSRMHLRLSRAIDVPRDADNAAMERLHAEMQASLDRVRLEAEARVSGDR